MGNYWVRRRIQEEEGPLWKQRAVVRWGLADHASSTSVFPSLAASQTPGYTPALSNYPAGKSLVYSPLVQKFHLDFRNTSGFNPQTSHQASYARWLRRVTRPNASRMLSPFLTERFLPPSPSLPSLRRTFPSTGAVACSGYLPQHKAAFSPESASLEGVYLSSPRDKSSEVGQQ